MIELRLLVDDIDYDSLVELLLPMVQEKLRRDGGGGVLGSMLGGSPEMAATMARTALHTMNQDKRDELVVQLVSRNREKLLEKGEAMAQKNGVKLKLRDVNARKV